MPAEKKCDVQLFSLLEYCNGNTDPIALNLQQGLKPSYVITVVGQTTADSAFEIRDSSGNILLHVVPRFAENVVILNSHFVEWGPEERTTNMPIKKNQKFSLTCAYEQYGYRIFIDGAEVAFYKHRSTNTPEKCTLGSGAKIFKISYGKGQPLWAVKNTTLHFGPHGISSFTTTLPELGPCSWIAMSRIMNAEYLGIDLLNEKQYILFHFNPRFNQSVVIRNSFLNGAWGVEEKEGGMPLTKGKPFCIAYVLETSCFRIYVNGEEFTTYNYRTTDSPKTIRIGGITLLKFSCVQ